VSFLYKREDDENELSIPARRVLSGVRRGLSPEDAAAEAGVTPEELRGWLRQPHYRAALRRKPAEAQLVNLDSYLSGPVEPRLTVNQHTILERIRGSSP